MEVAGTTGINSQVTDFVHLDDGASVADGTVAWAPQEITDQSGGAAVAAGADKNIFVLVGSIFADTDAVETAIETGDYELTIVAGTDDKDAFIVVYSDGTNAFIASAHFIVNPGTDISSGDLVVTNLLQISGVTAIAGTAGIANDGTLAANNLAFLA